jgi:hypothetical protein
MSAEGARQEATRWKGAAVASLGTSQLLLHPEVLTAVSTTDSYHFGLDVTSQKD